LNRVSFPSAAQKEIYESSRTSIRAHQNGTSVCTFIFTDSTLPRGQTETLGNRIVSCYCNLPKASSTNLESAVMLRSPDDSRDEEACSLMMPRTAWAGHRHVTLETGAAQTVRSDRVVGAHALGGHSATGLPVTEINHGDGQVDLSAFLLEREESIGWPHDPAQHPACSLLPGAFNPRADAAQLGAELAPQLEKTCFSPTLDSPDLFADLCDFDREVPASDRKTGLVRSRPHSRSCTPNRCTPVRLPCEEPKAPTTAFRETWSLSGYCQKYMNIRPHEIKPTALLRILDLTRLFYHMCAEGILQFVEPGAGSGQISSIFGFSRMLVSNVAEFNRRISDMIREDRRRCWQVKTIHVLSNITLPCYELLRQLGVHPVKGTRTRELSALDARNFMLHSEFKFSPDRMAKNCMRLKVSSVSKKPTG